jgi:anti-anti-sigma regulatory factor
MVVPMAMIAVWLKVDGEGVVSSLQEACDKLDASDGELFLDFSSVNRIDSEALKEMGRLAGLAADKQVKVALRGVGVDVYKVLKLVKLAPRFSFLA